MGKIKVWVKEPMYPARHVWISNTLENLQKTVDGYIEHYPLAPSVGIICNEEGRIKDLYYNTTIDGQDFFGTIIFVGYDGENFASCPLEKDDMKRLLPQIFQREV